MKQTLAGNGINRSGKVSANLYITEERGASITYSVSFDESRICMMVRDEKEKSAISE